MTEKVQANDGFAALNDVVGKAAKINALLHSGVAPVVWEGEVEPLTVRMPPAVLNAMRQLSKVSGLSSNKVANLLLCKALLSFKEELDEETMAFLSMNKFENPLIESIEFHVTVHTKAKSDAPAENAWSLP